MKNIFKNGDELSAQKFLEIILDEIKNSDDFQKFFKYYKKTQEYSHSDECPVRLKNTINKNIPIDKLYVFSDIEKYVIETLDLNDFEYIARNKDGSLYAFFSLPVRGKNEWEYKNSLQDEGFYMWFKNILPFIKWEDEPYYIPDLTELCYKYKIYKSLIDLYNNWDHIQFIPELQYEDLLDPIIIDDFYHRIIEHDVQEAFEQYCEEKYEKQKQKEFEQMIEDSIPE